MNRVLTAFSKVHRVELFNDKISMANRPKVIAIMICTPDCLVDSFNLICGRFGSAFGTIGHAAVIFHCDDGLFQLTNGTDTLVLIQADISMFRELSRVNAQAMQKLKEKDIIKIFPTQKPHCTTRLVLKTPKTETSNRTVWLPKTVAELLVQYQKDQKELQEFLGDAYNNYNLVIALENGNPVESRIVRDRFQKLCEQNGYEKVVFHSLRHLSTGYKLKMTNGDVKSVQGDTGHAEAEMVTDVYSEIIDEDRRYNAQKMDEQFYSTLNHDSEMQPQNEEFQPENNGLSDSDMELLQLLKSLTPEMKKMLLKQSASK